MHNVREPGSEGPERCPFCGDCLNHPLILGFQYCRTCRIAVRRRAAVSEQGKDFYDRAWVASQEQSHYNRARACYAARIIGRCAGVRKILDVGCGTGILTDRLARLGFEVCGADTSEEAVRYATANKEGQYFLYADTLEGLFEDQSFDLIILSHIIEHIMDPDAFLKSMGRLLKPGGRLYLETPNLGAYARYSLFRKYWGGMWGGGDHCILYAPQSLSACLARNGFAVEWCRTWSYSSKLLRDMMTTLSVRARLAQHLSGCRQTALSPGDEPVKNCSEASSKTVRGGGPLAFLKRLNRRCCDLAERFYNSRFCDAIMYFPNRISEIRSRGIQINMVARKSVPPAG